MGGCAKRKCDTFGNSLAILENLIVPESHDLETLRFQPAASSRITFFANGVLATINFEHQLCLETDEINDVGTNGGLTAEAAALDLSIAQQRPKAFFCLCLIRSQVPGGPENHEAIIPSGRRAGPPPSRPPPIKGGGEGEPMIRIDLMSVRLGIVRLNRPACGCGWYPRTVRRGSGCRADRARLRDDTARKRSAGPLPAGLRCCRRIARRD